MSNACEEFRQGVKVRYYEDQDVTIVGGPNDGKPDPHAIMEAVIEDHNDRSVRTNVIDKKNENTGNMGYVYHGTDEDGDEYYTLDK